jgi:hypothetical protein
LAGFCRRAGGGVHGLQGCLLCGLLLDLLLGHPRGLLLSLRRGLLRSQLLGLRLGLLRGQLLGLLLGLRHGLLLGQLRGLLLTQNGYGIRAEKESTSQKRLLQSSCRIPLRASVLSCMRRILMSWRCGGDDCLSGCVRFEIIPHHIASIGIDTDGRLPPGASPTRPRRLLPVPQRQICQYIAHLILKSRTMIACMRFQRLHPS